MKNTTKKQSYILVLDWMVDKYHLKGNELLAYALIYGFSQDGDSEYKGSFSYLTRWLGADRATIIRVLKRLESKGLISKRQELVSGQMVNRYVPCASGRSSAHLQTAQPDSLYWYPQPLSNPPYPHSADSRM